MEQNDALKRDLLCYLIECHWIITDMKQDRVDEVSEEVKSRLQKTMTMHLEKGLSVFDIVHCVTHAILKCQTEKKTTITRQDVRAFFSTYHCQKTIQDLPFSEASVAFVKNVLNI